MGITANLLPLTLAPTGPIQRFGSEGTSSTQIGFNVCWAACVESVLAHFQEDGTQAEIIEGTLPSCDLVIEGEDLSEECNQPLDPDQVRPVWLENDFANVSMDAVDPQDPNHLITLFEQNLDSGPIEAWASHTHLVLIYGYEVRSNGERKVWVMDPEEGEGDGWRSLEMLQDYWSTLWINLVI